MRRLLFTLFWLLVSAAVSAQEKGMIPGLSGGLSFKVSLPEGFNPASDRAL